MQKNFQLSYLTSSFSLLDTFWQKFLIEDCGNQLMEIDKKLLYLSNSTEIYPLKELIFNALAKVKINEIKAVILGQDPYHGSGEANGLAFSVNGGIKLPPSLKNILLELKQEYNYIKNVPADILFDWPAEGVLLLNSSLTVIKDKPNSLSNIGWEIVSDKIIEKINNYCTNIVFLLWGNFAREKAKFIDKNKHLILSTSHPSPFSVYKGFLGCNHFLLANEYLLSKGKKQIKWIKNDCF
jgi:uracil-DNA glycosylase